MKKDKLTQAVTTLKDETKQALQAVIDELNHGQKQKIIKNKNVKDLLDRYNVDYSK